MAKKLDWNLDAEEAILFLDWCVKANYAIGPTGGIPDWIAVIRINDKHKEKRWLHRIPFS